jgi:NTP pyrophosphatase (non-canonical NTP hydrolase)
MQTLVAMEELGELQHELSKFIRGSGDRDHLIEEYADVCIVMQQVQVMYNLRDYEILEEIRKKMTRLEERLDEKLCQKDSTGSN